MLDAASSIGGAHLGPMAGARWYRDEPEVGQQQAGEAAARVARGVDAVDAVAVHEWLAVTTVFVVPHNDGAVAIVQLVPRPVVALAQVRLAAQRADDDRLSLL